MSGLDEDDGFLSRSNHRPGRPEFDDGRAPRGPAPKFPVGSMVRHPQFGTGKVIAASGGVNARATIQFRDVGTKTLVLEFARLERVG